MTQLPIFYINLASRPDRRAFMEAQFARLGLEATRIEAFDRAAVPADYVARYGDARRADWLTPGEIACSLSHMEAMASIVRSGSPWGCILEDDVELSAGLPRFLDAVANNPPATLDMLRVEAVYRPLPMRVAPEPSIAGFGLYRSFGSPTGGGGYLVSAPAARGITADRALLGHAADDIFSAFHPAFRHLAIRQVAPALCAQHEVRVAGTVWASDLDSERGQRQAAETLLFWPNLWRKIVLIADRDIRQGGQKTWHQLLGAKKRQIEFRPN